MFFLFFEKKTLYSAGNSLIYLKETDQSLSPFPTFSFRENPPSSYNSLKQMTYSKADDFNRINLFGSFQNRELLKALWQKVKLL